MISRPAMLELRPLHIAQWDKIGKYAKQVMTQIEALKRPKAPTKAPAKAP
jgi:hypothetical protein